MMKCVPWYSLFQACNWSLRQKKNSRISNIKDKKQFWQQLRIKSRGMFPDSSLYTTIHYSASADHNATELQHVFTDLSDVSDSFSCNLNNLPLKKTPSLSYLFVDFKSVLLLSFPPHVRHSIPPFSGVERGWGKVESSVKFRPVPTVLCAFEANWCQGGGLWNIWVWKVQGT